MASAGYSHTNVALLLLATNSASIHQVFEAESAPAVGYPVRTVGLSRENETQTPSRQNIRQNIRRNTAVTTTSRINEILHEMEQDPELAQALRDRVLGQEISTLPAAVAQNQGLIIRLTERQVELADAVNNTLDAVVSAMNQAGENTAWAWRPTDGGLKALSRH